MADQAADSKPLNTVYGQASAPVTLTVYSSPTCPHCLEFERNYLPALRKDYVESRKLQITHKPFFAIRSTPLSLCLLKEKAASTKR
ncbi:thioredoxin domain-containing protein [Rhizobium leguminosarum]|uniref:thioredoxin domain-containing protein n=1 Tax=Rhizobium leguminosarum TaxID=384 RepID=UPI00143FA412|nr:thioredoxin domain-containing protein [Rhizobium leguminosarum bv. viciae]